MGFYFTVHLIMGVCLGAISWTMKQSAISRSSVPQWAWGGWGQISLSISVLSAIGAIIATLMQYPIIWALATAGEILLGAFVAGLIPLGLRFLIAALSAIINIFILGALWRLWYI